MSNRPIISLWPYILLAGLYYASAVIWMPGYILFFALFGLLKTQDMRTMRWLGPLITKVKGFKTIRHGQITLHFAPELMNEWDFPLLLQRCEREYQQIKQTFSDTSPRRGVVYLFASWRGISGVFGPSYAGTILLFSNAILVAYDQHLDEAMRHEFAHLFSRRWNPDAAPLLSEGLSRWLQKTKWTQPMDAVAYSYMADSKLAIRQLLDRRFFYGEPQVHSCYALAGSFTGFLIRHFGWEQYERLYRKFTPSGFQRDFRDCCGMDLGEAESLWHTELEITVSMIRGLKNHPSN